MSRQGPCANNRVTGCQGIVSQRGNIFCDSCNEARKSMTKSRRDQDVDELVKKNADLEKELIRLRQAQHELATKHDADYKTQLSKVEADYKTQLSKAENDYKTQLADYVEKIKLFEAENETLKKNIGDSSRSNVYNTQLEKENSRLLEIVSKLRQENHTLVKERETYELTHEQLKIDSQKIGLDNTRLKETNASLIAQMEELTKENALLSKTNQELSQPPPQPPPKPEPKEQTKMKEIPLPVKPAVINLKSPQKTKKK